MLIFAITICVFSLLIGIKGKKFLDISICILFFFISFSLVVTKGVNPIASLILVSAFTILLYILRGLIEHIVMILAAFVLSYLICDLVNDVFFELPINIYIITIVLAVVLFFITLKLKMIFFLITTSTIGAVCLSIGVIFLNIYISSNELNNFDEFIDWILTLSMPNLIYYCTSSPLILVGVSFVGFILFTLIQAISYDKQKRKKYHKKYKDEYEIDENVEKQSVTDIRSRLLIEEEQRRKEEINTISDVKKN